MFTKDKLRLKRANQTKFISVVIRCCSVHLYLALSILIRLIVSFRGKLYRGAQKPDNRKLRDRARPSAPPARVAPPRNSTNHPLSSPFLPSSSLTHDRRSRLFCACTRYITLSSLIHLRAHKELLALCALLPPCDFHGGNILWSLKATPLSYPSKRKGERGAFRFSSIQMAAKRSFDSTSGSKGIIACGDAYIWCNVNDTKCLTCLFNFSARRAHQLTTK